MDVTLFFWREWLETPQEQEAEDGEKHITVGSRNAFIEVEPGEGTNEGEDSCEIDIEHRRYPVHDDPIHQDWAEMVILSATKDNTPPEALCQAVTALAHTVVAGLPEP